MLIEEINILRHHGLQYVPDVSKVELTPLFRGRPLIKSGITSAEAKMLKDLCPTSAISIDNGLQIDLGICVFCKECQFACPGKITFTNNYHIATSNRRDLIIREGEDKPLIVDPAFVRDEIRRMFGRSLKLRQVSAGGDNSCEMELNAAGNVNFDMGRYGIEFVASPRHADGIVITGPVTENMSRALQITYDAIPHPKLVILVGSDAISGGIFAGSPAIQRNFLDNTHVDLYVPGNPAHPLTFINGILDMLGRKA
jgi:Ni,Fe-hydrogenase III small subunit